MLPDEQNEPELPEDGDLEEQSSELDNAGEENGHEVLFDEDAEDSEDDIERAPAAKKKKKKRSRFVDDAAEDDDEDHRLKRNRFIDDIADVDDEEEGDEDEDEGVEDLIEEDEAADANDIAEIRQAMRDADRKIAEEQEINPEELEKYIRDRFGNRRYTTEREEEGEADEVRQQTLVPTMKDPKLWVIRCADGQERELVMCLLQKAYDMADKGTPLLIKSAFCLDHLKGYIYVEAHKEAHAREALKGMRSVYHSKPPKLVPLNEMVDAITVAERSSKTIEQNNWVRLRSWVYKGDLAKVLDVDQNAQRATIKIVPRIDYAGLASRATDENKRGFPKPPKARPPPRAFNADEARTHRLDVVQQRDRVSGDVYFILNGTNRFHDGYLVKTVSLKSLSLEESLPPLDELQRFNAAAQGEAAADDLASLVQNLATEGDGSAAPRHNFNKGDKVIIINGDLKDIKGVIDQVIEDGHILVRPTDEQLAGFDEAIPFRPSELAKFFEGGAHVKIIHGQFIGQTGMVVRVEGPVCVVFTDGTRQEVRVFSRDLAEAVAVASSIDSIGSYDLFDFVALDPTTVGVIVGVDKDSCRVLTNQGRPDKPDIRTCRLPDLKRKIDSRRASTQDGARNEVNVNDIVEIVDGPLKGKSGTVRYIMRGFLFIQAREIVENGGYVCVQGRQCRVRGGKRMVTGGLANVHATPAHAMASPFPYSRAPNPNVLASPSRYDAGGFSGRGGAGAGGAAGMFSGRVTTHQDKLLEGREIMIRKGPYRGMKGRIIAIAPTHCRVELQAQMKTVNVDRNHIPEAAVGGAAAGGGFRAGPMGPPQMPASAVAALGRTPAHPGIMATPAHYGMMSATPMHPGMTPSRDVLTKTPAYDPVWANTPAYTGTYMDGPGMLPMDVSPVEHWLDCEVYLPNSQERGVVRGVDGVTGVTIARIPSGRVDIYPPDELQLVQPSKGQAVKILAGEFAGQKGELVSTAGSEAVLKIGGTKTLVLSLSNVGKLA